MWCGVVWCGCTVPRSNSRLNKSLQPVSKKQDAAFILPKTRGRLLCFMPVVLWKCRWWIKCVELLCLGMCLRKEGRIIFPQSRGGRKKGARQGQINGDKWSWEWDGPEARDINNASRHWLQHSALFVFSFMFYCQHYFRWWTTWQTADTRGC